MQDIVIENGRVIDWISNTDMILNISIKGGFITYVGANRDSAKKYIDAKGLFVIPGIIDSHMHASSWLAGPQSYKMLAKAGVTTALEMAGPLENIKKSMRNHGTGLSIGCLEMIRPGWNVKDANPSECELNAVIDDALDRGAFGVKLLGGHYPLTPIATATLIRICKERGVYLGVHAGSTKHGSNIEGVEELVELADGHAFHLAHTNAYCRGNIMPVEEEIKRVATLLKAHPEIDSESYLSPINGCSGRCVGDTPESNVTRNCLKSRGYQVSKRGLQQAIEDGFAKVHLASSNGIELVSNNEGLKLWIEKNTDAPISFPVNPSLSNFYFATQKRHGTYFLSDNFCTDGGGIPRNVIIESGLSLVKFKALTLKEFVFKSSTSSAQLLGLKNKGRLQVGADADITILDYEKQKAVHAFSMGKPTLLHGEVVGEKGTLVTTSQGFASCKNAGLKIQIADIDSLFEYRNTRFNI